MLYQLLCGKNVVNNHSMDNECDQQYTNTCVLEECDIDGLVTGACCWSVITHANNNILHWPLLTLVTAIAHTSLISQAKLSLQLLHPSPIASYTATVSNLVLSTE